MNEFLIFASFSVGVGLGLVAVTTIDWYFTYRVNHDR